MPSIHFARLVPAVALVLFVLSAGPGRSRAAWPNLPSEAVPVSEFDYSDVKVAVSDGAGGVIAVWVDTRSATQAVLYAQRVSVAGVPEWGASGVAVNATVAGDQTMVSAAADGAGGVLVAWRDTRSGTGQIYAQRLGPSGNRLWTATGVPVCVVPGAHAEPSIAADGAGGALIAWNDGASGPAATNIYAQHLNAAGAAVWSAGGRPVTTATSTQRAPCIGSDGAGGAVVAWLDDRAGASTSDVYAQRLDAAGSAMWVLHGYPVSTATGIALPPLMLADGTNGAILVWEDNRAGSWDVYAARITGQGTPAWTTNGVQVCTATSEKVVPAVVSDGASGAIVTWTDYRSAVETDIYAQRIGPGGGVMWAAAGVAVCTAAGFQFQPAITTDGAGGAIVTWYDLRAGTGGDVYARRVNANGAAQWASNGVLVASDLDDQYRPIPVADGLGGAAIVWSDNRRDGGYDQIRAQHVERYGQLGAPAPVLTSVRDVANDQGGLVKVSWDASYLDSDPSFLVFDYRLWRSAPQALATAGALRARGATTDPDRAAASGEWLMMPLAGQDYAWELMGTQSAGLLPSYSLVAATTGDSVAAGNPRTVFMVEARSSTSLSASRWYSAPDSGYSVDNLAPIPPAQFTGFMSGTQAVLDWNANGEADLAGYRLYRGGSLGFVPSPANRIASLTDTDYLDTPGAPSIYKLTAVDVHGNESAPTVLVPAGLADIVAAAPVLGFAPPEPNPARVTATLRFSLGAAGDASLVVYDASGRVVRTLARGAHEAGAHAARWDLRDTAGNSVAPGLYFARLVTADGELRRRLVVAR